MKKTKTQKGITLIALIITIVVLLILAVVTIGAVQESKIIGHAQNAADNYNGQKVKEEVMLENYVETIEKYLKDDNNISKTGYYTCEAYPGDPGTVMVWYIEFREENKINIDYYLVENNSIDTSLELGEFEIKEEDTETANITIDSGTTMTINPKYLFFEAGVGAGLKSYIKGNKIYVASEPEDVNSSYIEATLDENFVLPQ